MVNPNESAELIDECIEQLETLLMAQKKISNTLADNSLTVLIEHTKSLIKINTETAKYLRKMATDG